MADAIPRRSCIKSRGSTRPPRRKRNKLTFGGTEVKLYYQSDEERQFKLVMGKQEENKEARAVKVGGYSTSKIQMDELDDLDLFVSRRLKYKKAEGDGKRNFLEDKELEEDGLGLKTNQVVEKRVPALSTTLESQVEGGQERIGVDSCDTAEVYVDQITGIHRHRVNRDLVPPLDTIGDAHGLNGLTKEQQHQSPKEQCDRYKDEPKCLPDVEIPTVGHTSPDSESAGKEFELPTSWDPISRVREWQQTPSRGRDNVRVGLLNTSSAPNLGENPRHDYRPTQSRSADMSTDPSDPCRPLNERKERRHQSPRVVAKQPEASNPDQCVPSEGVESVTHNLHESATGKLQQCCR